MEFTFHPLELKTFRCKFKYFIVTLRRNTTVVTFTVLRYVNSTLMRLSERLNHPIEGE